jgi:twitching motility two-component system response regulator PilG
MPPDEVTATLAALTPLPVSVGRQLVAVVDDSATVRKILEVSLRRASYDNVSTFPDGIEMLRWLMTPQARIPGLVVVDLNLPKSDGYTLIRHLKTKPAFAHTTFVILSGRAGMLDKLKGRLSGASVYLTKPFRTQDIVALVHTYLGPPAPQDTVGMEETMRHESIYAGVI